MSDSDRSHEKRRFSRVDFNTTATITDNQDRWQSRLIDISLKGALLTLPEKWQGNIGDAFKIELPLDDSNVTIQMGVSVAHIQEQHVGFRCEHIDFDSITHLRRLMELNLGDAELVNRELSTLNYS